MKRIILLISCAALSGCTAWTQTLTAADASAVVAARSAADLAAQIAAQNLCIMTVDTLARNPQYVDAVVSLCFATAKTSPVTAIKALTMPPPPAAP